MKSLSEAAASKRRRYLPWFGTYSRPSVVQGSEKASAGLAFATRRRAWSHKGRESRKPLGEISRSYSSNTTIASDSGPLGALQRPEASTLLKGSHEPSAPDYSVGGISRLTTYRPATAVQQLPKGSSDHSAAPEFWSHKLQKSPEGKDIVVHYCRSLKSSEGIAQLFLKDDLIGLDLEWKASASAWDSIQDNVSLIQIANRHRIALFHVAQFRPAKALVDLVPPTLKRIIEDPAVTKAGVSIKADCTRLRKFLKIDAHGIFELSHLYKLIKYCQSDPKLINKRLVNLSEQAEEHLGLPLAKEVTVRCGEWSTILDYRQVQYAASDPYACVCLYDTMNKKRQTLEPVPPLPAHAELNLPIRVMCDAPVTADVEEVELFRPEDAPEDPKCTI
ncbi:3'-5' exonuclease [Aspergillus saccharolyticus JOP 1030-1]|uniref:Ribonuclease H-like protein n=1 Tax=Aspergillus saccharolyticus JOP 1030-1 TaxID=1450539 RepID=A0A318Z852_9EURO|nr:ribonuclease H-like protein [Aspergillus saccharolyticus JOP 1030-1]PYH43396.1 ribonuclease H-like protein [Aspergillus saccharolyticus JOP 1030-1]